MKVVILAGGLGTRLSEETELKPKPMVEIGGRPILWHITKHYASFGHKEFFVALGYKGEAIKRFFLDYQSLSGSMTIDLSSGGVVMHGRECEGWINGGFMDSEPAVFDYLKGDDDSLEADALEQLARERQLAAYRHDRFWQCMDTMRDMRLLESYWQSGDVPWKVWE